MQVSEPVIAPGWRAQLELDFDRRGARSVLAARRHSGPLVVQKSFHPEGDAVCHAIVVHPPGGICGGDTLALQVRAASGAHALLTTPGAGKWYRSAGALATQSLEFELAPGAALEWLPQESIVFDAARAHMRTHVRLAEGARYLGWEVLCLGRTASREALRAGELRLDGRLDIGARMRWRERARIDAAARAAPALLDARPVVGTLLAAGAPCPSELLARLREIPAHEGEGALSALPQVLVARYLGHCAAAARAYFAALWRELRPALLGRAAHPPRIWNT